MYRLILRSLSILLSISSSFAIAPPINANKNINSCCPNGTHLNWGRRCVNGTRWLNLKCSMKEWPMWINGVTDWDQHNYTIDYEKAILYARYDDLLLPYEKSKWCYSKLEPKNSTDLHDIVFFCVRFSEYPLPPESDFFAALEFLSAFFIFLTAAVYIYLKELRDVQGICILHFLVNLGITYTLIGILQYTGHGLPTDTICTITAFVLYFCSLCAFTWLNISSLNLWKAAASKTWDLTDRSLLGMYTILGYGFPVIMLIIVLCAQYLLPGKHPYKPRLGDILCWFSATGMQVERYFHKIPISILIFLNVVYFLDAARRLWKTYSRPRHLSVIRALRNRFIMYLKLFLVMGLPWTSEIMWPNFFRDKYIIVTMDVIKCLQGLVIFLVLIATRRKVYRLLAERQICVNYLPSSLAGRRESATEEESENGNEDEIEMSTRD